MDVLDLKTRLCLLRKPRTHPSEAVNVGWTGLIKVRAFSLIACLDIGMLLTSLFSRIHLRISSSISCGYESFLPWPFLFLRFDRFVILTWSRSSLNHL